MLGKQLGAVSRVAGEAATRSAGHWVEPGESSLRGEHAPPVGEVFSHRAFGAARVARFQSCEDRVVLAVGDARTRRFSRQQPLKQRLHQIHDLGHQLLENEVVGGSSQCAVELLIFGRAELPGFNGDLDRFDGRCNLLEVFWRRALIGEFHDVAL